MTCLLIKHKNFIKKLSGIKKNKHKLLNLIKNSKGSEIKSLSELTFNILNGHVYCSKNRKRLLKPHVNSLRLLGDKKSPIKTKKKVLLKGNGFFLSALLPIAISTIAGLLKK